MSDNVACDLCGDQAAVLLRAKCHLTAPLAVEYEQATKLLTVRCYLPECGKVVARFHAELADEFKPAAPRYRRENGDSTTADDPQRVMWYSASCGYWTDDWSKLKKAGGIPCCPTCGMVGMQAEYGSWMCGAEEYGETHPGYMDLIRRCRDQCLGAQFNKLSQQFT